MLREGPIGFFGVDEGCSSTKGRCFFQWEHGDSIIEAEIQPQEEVSDPEEVAGERGGLSRRS